jgi:RimJ/RimL family protein N-acetyltransferase
MVRIGPALTDDEFFTVKGQRTRFEMGSGEIHDGTGYSCVIEVKQSANLGYWVVRSTNGRGVATQSVEQVLRVAFGDLGLHRVQAGTLVHNPGSQKVPERNGFERIGRRRSYLMIAGQWQDHLTFQRLASRIGDPDVAGRGRWLALSPNNMLRSLRRRAGWSATDISRDIP